MKLLSRKMVQTSGFLAFFIGLILIGYIAFLAVAHYQAQMALKQASLRELTEQTEQLAGTLSYFLNDRTKDLLQLVESHEIRTYFENKALGMSPQYGLQASIEAVNALLMQWMDKTRLGEVPTYDLLAFIDSGGNVLASCGAGLSPAPGLAASFLKEKKSTYFGVSGKAAMQHIVIAEPFYFKKMYAGHFVALMPLEPVCRHFLPNQKNNVRGMTSLLYRRTCMYAPPDAPPFITQGAEINTDEIQSGRLQPWSSFAVSGSDAAAHRMLIPIAETPFSLLTFFPLAEQAGTQSALRILFTTAGVFLFFVAGIVFLLRQYRRNDQLQAQILQQDKLASVGQLAAGVAHEINNPTGFVYSNLNSLRKYTLNIQKFLDDRRQAMQGLREGTCTVEQFCAEAEDLMGALKIEHILNDIPDLISQSMDGAERIRRIVSDLKNFSHIDQNELKDVDINEQIESTLNVASSELRHKCTIEKHFLPLPPVYCNPGQINQVFLNILINAAHAIQEKGTILITTETVRPGAPDQQVKIAIQDSGSGIPENIRKKIFEPFFTTKDVGKGTGLGLSIAYDIITKHGGNISVESAVGRGTTFTILLPADSSIKQGGKRGSDRLSVISNR